MLFSFLPKHRPSAPKPAQHAEPTLDASRRRAMPERPYPPALPSPEIVHGPCYMSPREMAGWAHELYVTGIISWSEYGLAIPAELHPDYDRTIGALTGVKAAPDRPRDMLQEWEDRLAFLRRHRGWKDSTVKRTEHILSLLRRRLTMVVAAE